MVFAVTPCPRPVSELFVSSTEALFRKDPRSGPVELAFISVFLTSMDAFSAFWNNPVEFVVSLEFLIITESPPDCCTTSEESPSDCMEQFTEELRTASAEVLKRKQRVLSKTTRSVQLLTVTLYY